MCIVNWERVDTATLSVLMSLIAHLGPTARARLSRGAADDVRALLEGVARSVSLDHRQRIKAMLQGQEAG